MALTKTLQGLIERAERNGVAVKRIREGLVMGSYIPMSNYSEWAKTTPMIEQWRVTNQKCTQDGIEYENIIVDHYGTGICHIILNKTTGENKLHMWYGESNSDRDALNGLMEYYNLPHRFVHRPVNGGFQMVC